MSSKNTIREPQKEVAKITTITNGKFNRFIQSKC